MGCLSLDILEHQYKTPELTISYRSKELTPKNSAKNLRSNTPFGEVFIEERNNTWNTPYLFNGKELDEETGLYYYGARYYNPRISLWYGVDPRREEYAGEDVSGTSVPDYKSKYKALQQVIKDNYELFEVDYYAVDNDNYVDGEGFCCEPQTQSRNLRSIPTQNVDYEKLQYYYHSDHLGSASYITNLDGEVVQHVEYVPFGEVFIEERNNTWNTPYLFNGKELDEETGLYYYGARYYNPRISLWYGVDPMFDRYPNESPYCYVGNNPIAFVDPDGRTKYYNLAGREVRNIDDGSDKKLLLLITEKKESKVKSAISEGLFVNVPSNEVVKRMEDVYNKTEKTGNEHGFRVGEKGKISLTVEGSPTVINSEQWKPAVDDLRNQGDLVSYDVHSHPLEKNQQGDVINIGLAEPSETDIANHIGSQANIVLGYKQKNVTVDSGTGSSTSLGGSKQKATFPRHIGFFNDKKQIGKEVEFSTYQRAIRKINEE